MKIILIICLFMMPVLMFKQPPLKAFDTKPNLYYFYNKAIDSIKKENFKKIDSIKKYKIISNRTKKILSDSINTKLKTLSVNR